LNISLDNVQREASKRRTAELAQIDAAQLVEKKIKVVEVAISKAEQPANFGPKP